MTRVRLDYVHEYRDRHGKLRRYFRRPGFKRVALPGLPGSDEFMAAYQLALAGLLYTAQRVSDVIRMGRQHIHNGAIAVRQQKTATPLQIPIRAELQQALSTAPGEHLTFLVNKNGKPYTANGFGDWFRQRCDEAGLHHCTAHGLRKAACTRLADLGCTTHQIAAISGHKSLSEVERYTKAANQAKLARQAFGFEQKRTDVG